MLTGKALVTNMSTRSNVLAGKLIQFTKGDQVIDRDNCSVELGSICALVEEGMAEWWRCRQSHAHHQKL